MLDDDLHGLLIELEQRAAARGDTPAQRWARCRARLVAAFGEADVAAVEALADAQEAAGKDD